MKYSFFFVGLLFWGCAQQIPPTGGEKDNTPPKVVAQFPKNQTTNFSGKTIELEFDEYIGVENLNQQLLITPAIEGSYDSKVRPKGIKLTFDQSFKAKTTYSLNFRNTFKDVTERNATRNVKVVFSTGNEIDSLFLTGKVIDALTKKPIFDALVGLYKPSDTLSFAKIKPYYFTKTDSSGIFKMENLSEGNYKLAAIIDNNNNLLYETGKESVGFISPILSLPLTINNEIQVSFLDKTLQRLPKSTATSRYFTLFYQKGIRDASIIFQDSTKQLPFLIQENKQIKFFNAIESTDTLKAKIILTDSLGKVFSHDQKIKFKTKAKREESIREPLTYEEKPKGGGEVTDNFRYEIVLNKPISKLNETKIELEEDTVRKIKPVILVEINRVIVTAKVNLKRDIRLRMPKGTIISVDGDTLNGITNLFTKINPEKYGSIGGEVFRETEDFIVELLSASDLKVILQSKNDKRFVFNFIPEGLYRLRLIRDKNKNGRWDAGDPDTNQQPEEVIYLENPLKLKANFELLGNDFRR